MPPKKDKAVPSTPTLSDNDSEVIGSENLTTSTLITLTNEQFNALLNGVRESSKSVNSDSSEGFSARTATEQSSGSFAKCTARFDASPSADIESFIDFVTTYKDCSNISDSNALRGLPMLLEGLAASWWQGVKHSILDWNGALTSMREVYSRKLPAHLIYREIFSREQGLDESTEIFICRVRALFAQLNYMLSEEAQLDMTYGLLSRKVRKRLPRSDITTFHDLLRRSRDIEHSLKEPSITKATAFSSNKDASSHKSSDKVRVKCAYCKNYGHSKDSCGKLRKKEESSTPHAPPTNGDFKAKKPETISCYGCGKPGYIRSNCPACRKDTEHAASAEFFAAHVSTVSNTCPIIPIEILGFKGVAFVDTGATQSIAGYSLYQLLRNKGCEFKPITKTITYADGNPMTEDLLTVDVVIHLQNRVIPINMFILPKCTDNRTLLGVDFITRAALVIALPVKKWYFLDDPGEKYDFADDPQPREGERDTFAMTLSLLRCEEGILLKPEEKDKLSDLLGKHLEIFQPSRTPTKFAEHRIETGDSAPISMPPYRMSPLKKDILAKELTFMLESDVIEECESPWAAPVVLVPKKNGTMRVCVDYRGLNAVTTSDSYPLPRIDDLLHLAKQTTYMTTLDLRAGYWQVSVRECDRDKTAFVTPLGTYRFKRMPFGLRNAPATFQRLIDRLKSGLPNVCILAYLDDIFILSETFEEHLKDLECVFNRLELYGLRANREKCVFARSSVKFLGHYITPSGIKMDPDKVSAILNLSPPRNLKHLLTFIQTCSWYRRFMPDFANIARPLTDLTKKRATWTWGTIHQEAYDRLKQLLTTAPILRQADHKQPFVLKTDASSYALGACLLQGEGDDERPVEYASRLLTGAERNYTTTEREALAVVWSMEKFRGYLEGTHIVVYTDHQALRWLMNIKSPSGRLARWALTLQGFDFEVKYIPGRSNVIADTLSRPPCNNDDQDACPICTVSVTLPTFNVKDYREKQLADPELGEIITTLEKMEDGVEYSRWMNRGYLLNNGLLYRYNPDVDVEDAQLVVPEVERKAVLQQYHDDTLAGHNGYDGTYQRISRRYYWSRMSRYIKDYIKNCPQCQRYKISNMKPAGLVQTPVLQQRFETLSIDLFGPLPETEAKEKWVFIVEDVATKWVELFPLVEATALECAKTLIQEVFFRFGTPRKVISDNGTQFISSVMQQTLHCLGVKQSLIPVYHPEANPVERKNRELKTQLSILVGNEHSKWSTYLPAIRFALNTAHSSSTGISAAFLMFGVDLRTPDDPRRDLRAIVQNELFIEQATPYLLKLAKTLRNVRETYEFEQDRRKKNADLHRRNAPQYNPGDKVLVSVHALSNKKKAFTSKFAPKRDGPYIVLNQRSPTSYAIGDPASPGTLLGVYHTSHLIPFRENLEEGAAEGQPILPRRRRGRPSKKKV